MMRWAYCGIGVSLGVYEGCVLEGILYMLAVGGDVVIAAVPESLAVMELCHLCL